YLLSLKLFVFYRSYFSLDLPSFPTRRSSDLNHPETDQVVRLSFEVAGELFVVVSDPFSCLVPVGVPVLSVRCEKHLSADARELKDRKSTRLNSSHVKNSYAVFCLKKKNIAYIRLGSKTYPLSMLRYSLII